MWKDWGKKPLTVEGKKRRPVSFVKVIKQSLHTSLSKCFPPPPPLYFQLWRRPFLSTNTCFEKNCQVLFVKLLWEQREQLACFWMVWQLQLPHREWFWGVQGSSGVTRRGKWLETKARQIQAEGCMCGCYPKEQLIRECCSVSVTWRLTPVGRLSKRCTGRNWEISVIYTLRSVRGKVRWDISAVLWP